MFKNLLFSFLLLICIPGEAGSGFLQAPNMPMKFANPEILHPTSGKRYRIDWCLNWNKNCGRPTANAFCRRYGFRRSENFEQDVGIGHLTPTLIMRDNKICNQKDCDGFTFIYCVD
jgi:hypothetical protein